MLRDLARGFERDGWDVTVITSGPEKIESYDRGVRVLRVKAPIYSKTVINYLRSWMKMLFMCLKLSRKDLIVTMTDPPLLVVAGRILATIKRSRHIHWCQDLYPDLLPMVGLDMSDRSMRFFKALSSRAMRKCDKVVVIGRCMAKKLTHSGLRPGLISVIPNWPDYELLGPVAKKKRIRGIQRSGKKPRRMKTADDVDGAKSYPDLHKDEVETKFRVLYSGNLGRVHPLKTVLDAAEILNNDCPDIEFVFCGGGPSFDYLAAERAKRGLENVRLLSYQPARKLKSLMESGDIHLISMKHEVGGLLVPCKLYSALAVERPCILVGPEDSEVARIIGDFHAGAVVPQSDARKLAETIREYRLNGDIWWHAHEGATAAGNIFVPGESISSWIKRARVVVDLPVERKAA
jgi:glycosyltransferase involved in cell wall biosynthesis